MNNILSKVSRLKRSLKGALGLNYFSVTRSLQDGLGLNYFNVVRIKRFSRNFGFTRKKQLEFIQDLASWINDGCNPIKACEAIMAGAKHNSRLIHEYRAAESIHDALSRGRSIAEGMQYAFEPEVVSIFAAGQRAGEMALNESINAYLQQQSELAVTKKAFYKPLKLPFIYLCITCGALIGMGNFIFPRFVELLGGQEQLPTIIKCIMMFSQAMIYLPFYIFLFIGLWLLARHYIRNNVTERRFRVDNYFPFNVYKAFVAMRVLKTLGILVGANNTPRQAALELMKHSSQYTQYHLQVFVSKSERGVRDLADMMDSGLLSKRLLFRLRLGSASADHQSKQLAIQSAAARSGDEAIASLAKTKYILSITLWFCLGMGVCMLGGSFMLILGDIMSKYQ